MQFLELGAHHPGRPWLEAPNKVNSWKWKAVLLALNYPPTRVPGERIRFWYGARGYWLSREDLRW